jgi:hypothetical protein
VANCTDHDVPHCVNFLHSNTLTIQTHHYFTLPNPHLLNTDGHLPVAFHIV